MVGWFGAVIGESEAGAYNRKVDVSFRWGMSWFIFSEVMFFASFFGALYYARAITLPSLGDFDHKLLWPDFHAVWPNTGPAGIVEDFTKIHAWPLPTVNTILLVTSGVWLTIAHHALRRGERGKTAFWLFMTLAFGFAFVAIQAYEYAHAYRDLNLRLDSGIFGSTFFMLTGFHGFHVLVGAIMLTVVLLRVLKGHFKPDNHFAFEAAAWYWHFVDVVWIGLYIVVYWL
jgi:cytochrome c oxidase subunit 3